MVNDVEILCKTVQCQVINFFNLKKVTEVMIAFDPGGGGSMSSYIDRFSRFFGSMPNLCYF